MAIIVKKAWPVFFQAVLDGTKSFDVRLADFSCKPGDTLVLKEFDPVNQQFTGRELTKTISFALNTNDIAFWSKDELEAKGLWILSLK